MAEAFPQSRFYGSDYHESSIEQARRSAERAGVADRVEFEVAGAQTFAGRDLDLVCIFDALHDMGDPVGAATRVRAATCRWTSGLPVDPCSGEGGCRFRPSCDVAGCGEVTRRAGA